jgi:protein gp37
MDKVNLHGIEWTDKVWNPVTGCEWASPGCDNCYARHMAKRLKAIGQENYRNGFTPTEHRIKLLKPLTWKKPKRIFVNSMSDLFHNDISVMFIREIFDVMRVQKHHIFQILTKRTERLTDLCHVIEWPKNVWMGVSVESEDYLYRIDDLSKTGAAVKFVSFEPLLGPIWPRLLNMNWVIVGGESGPGARPMDPEWVRPIRDECIQRKVPFFFKQWGGVKRKEAGRLLDSRAWEQFPGDV